MMLSNQLILTPLLTLPLSMWQQFIITMEYFIMMFPGSERCTTVQLTVSCLHIMSTTI